MSIKSRRLQKHSSGIKLNHSNGMDSRVDRARARQFVLPSVPGSNPAQAPPVKKIWKEASPTHFNSVGNIESLPCKTF